MDEKKELVAYKDAACWLCNRVHQLCWFFNMRNKQFFLCPLCFKELKDAMNG